MNRNHTVKKYKEIVDYIKEYLPNATIFTDIIVGFCKESEEQFNNTKKLMEEVKYNTAYIACYSPRVGALSARWEDNIPLKVKKERLAILTTVVKKTARDYNETFLNKTIKVLLTGLDRKGFVIGHNEGKIQVRLNIKDDTLIGSFYEVYINNFKDFNLEGEIINV